MIEPSIWVAAEGVGAAIIAAAVTMWGSRKLFPFQSKAMAAQAKAAEVSAAESAVQSVRLALEEARTRIGTLEHQIDDLNGRINGLQSQWTAEKHERQRIDEALNISLGERAAMRQEIIDLRLQIASGEIAPVHRPDAIVMVGLKDGIISYANDGVYKLFGYTPLELVDKPLDLLVPEYLREVHSRNRSGYALRPRTRPMGTGLDLKARRRDGTTVDVDISLHPVGGDDGRVIALVKERKSAPAEPAEHQSPSPDSDAHQSSD